SPATFSVLVVAYALCSSLIPILLVPCDLSSPAGTLPPILLGVLSCILFSAPSPASSSALYILSRPHSNPIMSCYIFRIPSCVLYPTPVRACPNTYLVCLVPLSTLPMPYSLIPIFIPFPRPCLYGAESVDPALRRDL